MYIHKSINVLSYIIIYGIIKFGDVTDKYYKKCIHMFFIIKFL